MNTIHTFESTLAVLYTICTKSFFPLACCAQCWEKVQPWERPLCPAQFDPTPVALFQAPNTRIYTRNEKQRQDRKRNPPVTHRRRYIGEWLTIKHNTLHTQTVSRDGQTSTNIHLHGPRKRNASACRFPTGSQFVLPQRMRLALALSRLAPLFDKKLISATSGRNNLVQTVGC